MAIIEANKKKVVGESLTLSKNLNVPTRYLDDQKQLARQKEKDLARNQLSP